LYEVALSTEEEEMWQFAESLREKSQQRDVGVAGVAVGYATTSVSQ